MSRSFALHTRVMFFTEYISKISVGISSAVTHAPDLNFEARTTDGRSPVANAPVPFTSMCHARALVVPSLLLPVNDHTCLRERESEKGSNGVERDQSVGDSLEEDQNDCREAGERVDAVRKEQAPSSQDKDMGQVVVQGDGAGQAREIRKGGVRAQSQGQQNAAHGQEVEPSAPKTAVTRRLRRL